MRLSRNVFVVVAVLAASALLVFADEARQAFGFNAPLVAGFPGGRSVELTGGGAYKLSGFVQTGGSFRCLSSITAGPFAGCLAGQGVRWDAATLLPSTTFKCTGAATEVLKSVSTGNTSVALLSDFYRQGDGDEESFTAQMIVSKSDIAPDVPGVQTVWIQGIGCGDAISNFNR